MASSWNIPISIQENHVNKLMSKEYLEEDKLTNILQFIIMRIHIMKLQYARQKFRRKLGIASSGPQSSSLYDFNLNIENSP